MKILKREYDLSVSEVKGYEMLLKEQVEHVDSCNLTRFIVVLDESEYTINKEGCPEMTQSVQKEYDDFVAKIREMTNIDKITVFDEGYGTDEDELEWHISGGVKNTVNGEIVDIIVFETCVRTEES